MKRRLTSFLLLSVLFAAFIQAQVRPAAAYSFGSPVPVTSASGFANDLPTALQASDGTVWMAWRNFNIRSDIFYQKSSGGVWSPASNLTGPSTSSYNVSPSLAQLQNGTIVFAWATNVTRNLNIFYKTFTGGVWTVPRQVTSGVFSDTPTSMTVTSDGTLWLVWQRETASSSCLSGFCRQIYYRTLVGDSWSNDTPLTTDNTTWNMFPSITFVRGGGVWASYAKYNSANVDFTVFYQVFNGTRWSTATPLTTAFQVPQGSQGDRHPNLIEDRNGTIWFFWTREMSVANGVYQDKLWYEMSPDAGATWSPAAQLTFGGNSTLTLDDTEPVAIQGLDKSLWIFYSSDTLTNGMGFSINLIKTGIIYPVAALAVTSIKTSLVRMFPWGNWTGQAWQAASINVTVANIGDFLENVQLTLQAVNKTSFTIGTASGFLAGGSTVTFSFTWNATATGAPPGRYSILASIPRDTANGETIGSSLTNTLSYKTVKVYYPGDVNMYGTVNAFDLSKFLSVFGTTCASPNWYPNADTNRDCKVNAFDLSTILANFGKSI